VCVCADAVMLVSDEGKPQPFDNDDVSVSAAGVATDHYIHRLMLIMMMMMMMMMMMIIPGQCLWCCYHGQVVSFLHT